MKCETLKKGILGTILTVVLIFPQGAQAQSLYEQSRELYRESLEQLSNTQSRLTGESDETLRAHLSTLLTVLEARLDSLEAWTEANPDLLVIDREVILAEIADKQEELSVIEATLNDARTTELISLKQTLKELNEDLALDFRHYTTRLMLSRLSTSQAELSDFGKQLEQEYDSVLDNPEYKAFKKILDETAEELSSGRDSLNNFAKARNKEKNVADTRTIAGKSYSLLKDAYSSLRTVLLEL
jgi:hypothetical protein